MIFPEVMKRIQDLSGIGSYHLSPIIFGSNVAWLAATTYILASQQMPSQDSQGRKLLHSVSIVANLPITAVEGHYRPF